MTMMNNAFFSTMSLLGTTLATHGIITVATALTSKTTKTW